MKVAIMGTGGVGGYFGGLLARNNNDVYFIARGAHLEAIREWGLKIKSVHGDFTVFPATVTDDPSEVGPVDLVIVATKTYHTGTAATTIRPMVGEETTVLSLQNGIDAAERIGAIVGMEHILGGATWVSAAIEEPGVIGQYSDFHRIVLGELDGTVTERSKKVHRVLEDTGITSELSDNILKILWTKYVFIGSVSAIGTLTRASFGEFRCVPETRVYLEEALREIAAVAQAKGIGLDQDVIQKTLEFIDGGAPNLKTSFQRDIEAGKPSELESMVGAIPRLGAELGIATPVMSFAYAMLKPGELKAQCV